MTKKIETVEELERVLIEGSNRVTQEMLLSNEIVPYTDEVPKFWSDAGNKAMDKIIEKTRNIYDYENINFSFAGVKVNETINVKCNSEDFEKPLAAPDEILEVEVAYTEHKNLSAHKIFDLLKPQGEPVKRGVHVLVYEEQSRYPKSKRKRIRNKFRKKHAPLLFENYFKDMVVTDVKCEPEKPSILNGSTPVWRPVEFQICDSI